MKKLHELQLWADNLSPAGARLFLEHVLTWRLIPSQGDSIRRRLECEKLLAGLDGDTSGQGLERVREFAHRTAYEKQDQVSSYVGGLG